MRDALARLGLVTVALVGPLSLRERLAGELGAAEAREVDLLAGLLAS